MLLFCAPRRQHRPRYVGTSCLPLPSTPRAHLAASPLPLYLDVVQSLCAGTVATDQRAFVFDQARAWRASPHTGLGRVLPPQRVGVRLPLLWGRQIGTARLGLNCVFCFTDGVRIESESQEQCEWMYRMFSHHCLPSPASWCFILVFHRRRRPLHPFRVAPRRVPGLGLDLDLDLDLGLAVPGVVKGSGGLRDG